jgi:hypothetical protein
MEAFRFGAMFVGSLLLYLGVEYAYKMWRDKE